MALLGFNLPRLDAAGRSKDKEIKEIVEYLYDLEKKLRYIISNLDGENFTEGFSEELSDEVNKKLNVSGAEIRGLQSNIEAVRQEIDGFEANMEEWSSHINDKENPHEVTAEQTGAVPEGQGLPPGGAIGQALIKYGAGDYEAGWSPVAGGTGGVSSVNGVSPDENGNVEVGTIPAGGTAGQVLAKSSDVDYDAGWTDAAKDASEAEKLTLSSISGSGWTAYTSQFYRYGKLGFLYIRGQISAQTGFIHIYDLPVKSLYTFYAPMFRVSTEQSNLILRLAANSAEVTVGLGTTLTFTSGHYAGYVVFLIADE